MLGLKLNHVSKRAHREPKIQKQYTHVDMRYLCDCYERVWYFYSLCLLDFLDPGLFKFKFRKVIFKLTLVNGGWGISYEIALI